MVGNGQATDGREAGAAGSRPPHVVLFLADDYSWHDMGAYGARDVRTPNLDRLAGGGMRFERAYAASATCAPSRSATLTGLYPVRNGAHTNHSLIREGIRTLPTYMAELGYRVVSAGKTHFGPREAFPFEYLAGSNIMPAGKDHVLWTDLNTGAVDELLAGHDREKPLCLLIGSHSPHVYWEGGEQYDPAKVNLPPYLVDTPETRAERCRYYDDVERLDRQVGEVLASLARHGYADQTLFAFSIDHGAQWPFAKWTLYDAGVRAPLLVRWPGRVRPGSVSDALVSLIDLLPTFVEAAGGQLPGGIDGRSYLKVLTGECAEHRDDVFASHTGDQKMNRSPMRMVRSGKWKYIANLAPEIPYQTHIDSGEPVDGKVYWDTWVRAAERGDARAAEVVRRYRHKAAEELYDLEGDPYELTNLAGRPEHGKVLEELRGRVRRWREEQGEDVDGRPLMPEDARLGELKYAG